MSLKALILAASELQILDNGRRVGEYKLVGAREVCISFIKVGKVCCVSDELLMDDVYFGVRVVKMVFFLVCRKFLLIDENNLFVKLYLFRLFISN